MSRTADQPDPGEATCVTVDLAGQAFAIPIGRVRDVFRVGALTEVPLAPPEIAGLINLRGRIVTAIDLRRRFGLPDRAEGATPMAVGIEDGADALALLVDAVGDVVALAPDEGDDLPPHLTPAWAGLCTRVHRQGDRLVMVMDVGAAIDLDTAARVARPNLERHP